MITLIFRFGVKMNKKGFVMPTVLGFIIITSSMILVQSVSVVGELLSMQAEVENVKLLNYAVNTKRVINELKFEETCRHETKLESTNKDHQFVIEANCIYKNTELDTYNQVIDKIFSSDSLSPTEYEQLYKESKIMSSKITNNQVELINKDKSLNSSYEEQDIILFVCYDQKNKIIIVNPELEVVRNTNVK